MRCHNCGLEIKAKAKFCPRCGGKLENVPVAEIFEHNVLDNVDRAWPEWQIDKKIGKGSYGVVYKAIRRDSNVESHAAIKVISIPADSSEIDSLRSEGLDEEGTRTYFKGIVDEFVSEIQLMESLKGVQNIVNVEDYKVVEKTDSIGWDIYIRMELLTPFNNYICDNSLTEDDVIKVGCDICSALEICAQRGIVHRDIKPENIFINDFGHFKLGDFGIARKLENVTSGLSQKGTYNYMAPEVANSKDYDARVDTYSLGIVLYRLLNDNRLPFIDTDSQLLSHGERKQAADRRIRGETLSTPCNASPEMADVILRACAYNPDNRFASATEMKKALMSVANGTYVIPVDDLEATAELKPEELKTPLVVASEQKEEKKKRGLWWIFLLILLVVALIGLAAWALGRGDSNELTDASTTTTDASAPDITTTVSTTKQEATTKRKVESISIVSMPKTDYAVGEKLDTSGLSLRVVYSDGNEEIVSSGFTCTPTAFYKAGTSIVDVCYGNKWTSFAVAVRENTCTVSFNANGGSVSETTRTLYDGEVIGSLPTPTREGFDFLGWYDENGIRASEYSVYSVDKSFTLTAKWSVKAYKVSWNTGTGYTISVRRTSSPNANAGTGTLSNGSTIYYGDVLSVTYTKKDYYTITSKGDTSITVNGNVTSSRIYATASLNPTVEALASNVPSGAQVVSTRWTYTRTQTTESTSSSMSGWTQTGSYWKKTGSGSFEYSDKFSTYAPGFDTSHSIYSMAKAPYTAYENSTTKRTVSNSWAGYIYWHWMYDCDSANAADRAIYYQKGTGTSSATGNSYGYKYFGAFKSTTNYSSVTHSHNQNSTYYKWYKVTDRKSYADSQGTLYWYRFDYYTCSYTDYQKIFQYKKVTTNISSSTAVTAGGEISNVQKWVTYRAK